MRTTAMKLEPASDLPIPRKLGKSSDSWDGGMPWLQDETTSQHSSKIATGMHAASSTSDFSKMSTDSSCSSPSSSPTSSPTADAWADSTSATSALKPLPQAASMSDCSEQLSSKDSSTDSASVADSSDEVTSASITRTSPALSMFSANSSVAEVSEPAIAPLEVQLKVTEGDLVRLVINQSPADTPAAAYAPAAAAMPIRSASPAAVPVGSATAVPAAVAGKGAFSYTSRWAGRRSSSEISVDDDSKSDDAASYQDEAMNTHSALPTLSHRVAFSSDSARRPRSTLTTPAPPPFRSGPSSGRSSPSEIGVAPRTQSALQPATAVDSMTVTSRSKSVFSRSSPPSKSYTNQPRSSAWAMLMWDRASVVKRVDLDDPSSPNSQSSKATRSVSASLPASARAPAPSAKTAPQPSRLQGAPKLAATSASRMQRDVSPVADNDKVSSQSPVEGAAAAEAIMKASRKKGGMLSWMSTCNRPDAA